jgi:multidrug transporter EmrE-like cation transporter
MVLMKLWDGLPLVPAAALILLALFGAVAFEIFALRLDRLGLVYAAILGAEVVMLAAVTYWGFGERFSPREIAGVGLIVSGAALAWS